jgi:hypothetical protein
MKHWRLLACSFFLGFRPYQAVVQSYIKLGICDDTLRNKPGVPASTSSYPAYSIFPTGKCILAKNKYQYWTVEPAEVNNTQYVFNWGSYDDAACSGAPETRIVMKSCAPVIIPGDLR